MRTTILLVDDHQVLRQGLRQLLSHEADMHVVAEAANGRDAVRLAAEHSPNVVVMDISMPDLNGIEATRQILNKAPAAKVIALSAHADHRMVAEILKAGAMGYTLKESAYEELVLAIRAVRAGKIYLSSRLVGSVVDHYVRRDGDGENGAFAKLTPREREVLQLMAEGKSTKEVAAGLTVSTKTVETHRRQIMEKLDLHSVAELTKYAIREGLTSLEP